MITRQHELKTWKRGKQKTKNHKHRATRTERTALVVARWSRHKVCRSNVASVVLAGVERPTEARWREQRRHRATRSVAAVIDERTHRLRPLSKSAPIGRLLRRRQRRTRHSSYLLRRGDVECGGYVRDRRNALLCVSGGGDPAYGTLLLRYQS